MRKPSQGRLMEIIGLQRTIVTAPMELGTVLNLIAERATALTHGEGAMVELVAEQHFEIASAGGMLVDWKGQRFARAGSLSGLCVDQRETLVCDDTQNDPRVDGPKCFELGVLSAVATPLFHGAEVIGVLKIVSCLPSAFTDEDVVTMTILADVVAAAIAHARQFEQVLHASLHDLLTQLPNRRAFEHRLATELERQRRYGEPVTLVMMDLDGFKKVNDTLGHGAGDAVLRDVGAIIRGHVRTLDAAYRLGGDEFAIILPHTTEEQAMIPVARVVAAVEEARLAHGLIGVSCGVAQATSDDAHALCALADDRLYDAKRAKRAS